MVTAQVARPQPESQGTRSPLTPTTAAPRVAIYDTYLRSLGGGEKALAVLAEVIEREHVGAQIDLLTHEDVADEIVERLGERFNVSLSRTGVRRLPSRSPARSRLTQPLARFQQEKEVSRASGDYDLFINNTIFSVAVPRSRRSLYMCMFPLDPKPYWADESAFTRLLSIPYSALRRRMFNRWVGSYDVIASNSEFTAGWVQRYWDLQSVVLHPPVEHPGLTEVGEKQKKIVGLGRFFPGAYNKKHDVLIQAFRGMPDLHRAGWELHLAGGVTPDVGTEDYLEHLRALAAGLPVRFHLDMPKSDLDDLLRSSALFWHATGFGEQSAGEPYRFEHFGLATVEAMSFGCVPLAFHAGGQAEIIESGRSGVLWTSTEELGSWTKRLASDRSLRTRLARGALQRSERFTREVFSETTSRLLRDLLER